MHKKHLASTPTRIILLFTILSLALIALFLVSRRLSEDNSTIPESSNAAAINNPTDGGNLPDVRAIINKTLESSGDVGYDSVVRITSDGKPVIVYSINDNGQTDFKLIKCSTLRCSTKEVRSIRIPGTRFSGYLNMELDSSNNPHVSFSNEGVNYVRCLDNLCSNYSYKKVEPHITGGVGSLDMMLNSDDFGVFVYPIFREEFQQIYIKYLRCLDLNCNTKDEEWITSGDTAKLNLRRYSDAPRIMFTRPGLEESKELWLSSCSDETCTSDYRRELPSNRDVKSYDFTQSNYYENSWSNMLTYLTRDNVLRVIDCHSSNCTIIGHRRIDVPNATEISSSIHSRIHNNEPNHVLNVGITYINPATNTTILKEIQCASHSVYYGYPEVFNLCSEWIETNVDLGQTDAGNMNVGQNTNTTTYSDSTFITHYNATTKDLRLSEIIDAPGQGAAE